MRAQRSWLLLLGAVGVACATAEPLDSAGNPITFPDDGSFGGRDASVGGGMATGGYSTETGGYTSTGGAVHTGGISTGSGGGSSTGGGKTNTGGVNQGGSGGTLPETGGKASTGGRSSTGGAAPTGGATSMGGTSSGGRPQTDASACGAGEKYCGGVCTPPAPGIGCDLSSSCTACPGPAPANGVLACDKTNNTCSFVCLSGFTKQGNSCVSNSGNGGSGNGGSTGTGGSTTGCVASQCPSCGVVLGPACCVSGKCGCPIFYIPGSCH